MQTETELPPAQFKYVVVERKQRDENGKEHVVYVDEPRIVFTVDNHTKYERVVEEKDKAAFPIQWAAFSRDGSTEWDGVPLEKAGFLTPATIKNLNHMGIFTVEHLANIPEGQIGGMMGGIDFRTKAQKFLATLEARQGSERLQELEDTLEIQRQQLEEMKEMLAASEAARKAAESDKPSKTEKAASTK